VATPCPALHVPLPKSACGAGGGGHGGGGCGVDRSEKSVSGLMPLHIVAIFHGEAKVLSVYLLLLVQKYK
jgi:hypothetical protein